MEVIEWILQDENSNEAIKSVKNNKGAYGMDKMIVEELDRRLAKHIFINIKELSRRSMDSINCATAPFVRGRVERMTREVESGTHGCRGARKR